MMGIKRVFYLAVLCIVAAGLAVSAGSRSFHFDPIEVGGTFGSIGTGAASVGFAVAGAATTSLVFGVASLGFAYSTAYYQAMKSYSRMYLRSSASKRRALDAASSRLRGSATRPYMYIGW